MSAPLGLPILTRRAFLERLGSVLPAAALSTLFSGASASAASAAPQERRRGAVRPMHFRPRARRVVHLCMAGGPSHLETLDPKMKLAVMDGEPMPESFTKGQQIAQLQGQELRCLAPQHPFRRFGRSGRRMCARFPLIGSLADDICVVRSMTTQQINHDPAHTMMNTGAGLSGRPGMGAWITYGLGT